MIVVSKLEYSELLPVIQVLIMGQFLIFHKDSLGEGIPKDSIHSFLFILKSLQHNIIDRLQGFELNTIMLQNFTFSNNESKLINSFIIVKFKNPTIKIRFKILEIKIRHQERSGNLRHILALNNSLAEYIQLSLTSPLGHLIGIPCSAIDTGMPYLPHLQTCSNPVSSTSAGVHSFLLLFIMEILKAFLTSCSLSQPRLKG